MEKMLVEKASAEKVQAGHKAELKKEVDNKAGEKKSKSPRLNF